MVDYVLDMGHRKVAVILLNLFIGNELPKEYKVTLDSYLIIQRSVKRIDE